jgi:hypothetical protein
MHKTFTPQELEDALIELGGRLAASGVQATFYLVGGAAMSIGYLADRRSTDDIDAKVAGFDQIQPVVEQMAMEFGYRRDWLNTAAAKLISQMNTDADWVLWKSVGGATFYIASPELLLAMKVMASRANRDLDDIAALIEHLGLNSFEAVSYIFEHYFPGELPPAKANEIVSRILNSSNPSV